MEHDLEPVQDACDRCARSGLQGVHAGVDHPRRRGRADAGHAQQGAAGERVQPCPDPVVLVVGLVGGDRTDLPELNALGCDVVDVEAGAPAEVGIDVDAVGGGECGGQHGVSQEVVGGFGALWGTASSSLASANSNRRLPR